jgi:hypothetical protein
MDELFCTCLLFLFQNGLFSSLLYCNCSLDILLNSPFLVFACTFNIQSSAPVFQGWQSMTEVEYDCGMQVVHDLSAFGHHFGAGLSSGEMNRVKRGCTWSFVLRLWFLTMEISYKTQNYASVPILKSWLNQYWINPIPRQVSKILSI